MLRVARALLALMAGVTWLPSVAAALTTSRVASDLRFPVFVGAPSGDDRLFIVEQRGVISILEDGVVHGSAFLDIDPLVAFSGGEDERGLLGLAFHPDYGTNGYFYINYVNNFNDTVIKRYRVSSNPNIADPTDSMTVLVFRDVPDNRHRGGTLMFGPNDHFLYIGMGDGSIPGDPPGNAQNDMKLLGKMLRIDVDGGIPYAIPPDNPYVGLPPLDEIWAKGFRNPYRWSFDRVTGDLYIGDVGQNCWEEISFQSGKSGGAENYGWNVMEAAHCFDLDGPCDPPGCSPAGLVLPIHEYSHGGQPFRCSVTGGCVYRGSDSSLQGTYFFADFCTHQIWSFRYVNDILTDFTERTTELVPGGGLQLNDIAAFGEDGFGELYIVDRGTGTDGEIYRVVTPSTGIGASEGPGFGSMSPIVFVSLPAPNPFSAATAFEIELTRKEDLTLSVFDGGGRLVRHLASGASTSRSLTFTWDGRDRNGADLPSGIYFLRAEVSGETRTRRLCLIR